MAKKEKPIKKTKIIWIIAAIVYIISPIDLIPEVFPFLGQIDDIAVILALAWQLIQTFGLDKSLNLDKFKKTESSKNVKSSDVDNEVLDAEIIED